MYRKHTVLSLILLVSEMLKIPRAKFEAHFLKKLNFVTNKCLAQDAFGKFPMTTEVRIFHLTGGIHLFIHLFEVCWNDHFVN